MPIPSVRMAVAKNPGLLSSTLTPNLMSFQKESILATPRSSTLAIRHATFRQEPNHCISNRTFLWLYSCGEMRR
jgi:hypothetical protein